MDIVLILGIVFLAYEVLARQASAAQMSATGPLGTGVVPPPAAIPVAPSTNQIAEESTAASGVSVGLGFIPVVGPVLASAFNALTGGLIAASAKRAAAARNENAAVAAAVPGWDAGVSQTVAAYNAGTITLSQLFQIIMAPQVNDPTVPSGQGILWSNYWKECGPQIQAGRNGCQTGTVTQPTTASFCSGSYGASCCVGYDNLKNGAVYIMQAAARAEANPGVAFTSTAIPKVFASKYGGVDRAAYTVTLKKPTATSVFSLSEEY